MLPFSLQRHDFGFVQLTKNCLFKNVHCQSIQVKKNLMLFYATGLYSRRVQVVGCFLSMYVYRYVCMYVDVHMWLYVQYKHFPFALGLN